MNNTAEKPPVGSGLNSQCKVTLEGVFKKSKTGQQPDAAAVAAFRKRLARYCSEMGARFIDYKPEGGIWMFEVRYMYHERFDQLASVGISRVQSGSARICQDQSGLARNSRFS